MSLKTIRIYKFLAQTESHTNDPVDEFSDSTPACFGSLWSLTAIDFGSSSFGSVAVSIVSFAP